MNQFITIYFTDIKGLSIMNTQEIFTVQSICPDSYAYDHLTSRRENNES
jgi:hypothetical protein